MESIEITKKILALNEKANSISSVPNRIIGYIDSLNNFKQVTVGYRSSCRTTHVTMKQFSLWKKVVKEIKLQGFEVLEENIKVPNEYASNNGGFWNEIKYTIKPLL